MWRLRLLVVLALTLSGPLYFVAYQARPLRHFGIGYWDSLFLADEESFYPPFRTSGPYRHPDESVEVREFVGRLTRRRAGFEIPYHALRSPLRKSLRCHRFALEGIVELTVNGELINEFVFAETSYPWAGIKAVIPQNVAEKGALKIDLVTKGGRPPPSHLPSDLGLGVDWIEIEPMSGGVWLLPTGAEWTRWFLFLVLAYVFLRFVRAGPGAVAAAMIGIVLVAVAAEAVYPVVTSRTLASAWLAFPGLMVLIGLAELIDRRSFNAGSARVR